MRLLQTLSLAAAALGSLTLDARANGVTTVLLAPEGLPDFRR